MRSVSLAHTSHDGLSYDVAGGQICEGVLSLHESDAIAIAEYGTFSTHRLRDQRLLAARLRSEPHNRGMKLHEFKISNISATTQRERNAISGRHIWVGRL
jgi:hypothetical protein